MKKLSVLVLLAVALIPGCRKKNQSPEGAVVPAGANTAYRNTVLKYTTSAEDPDGDSVAVRFDWGDGGTSAWSALAPGGTLIADSHAWVAADTYRLRAKARDKAGLESDWSTPLEVAVVAGGWIRVIGGIGTDYGNSVVQVADGGYVLAGYVFDVPTNAGRIRLLKTDSLGNVEWDRAFGDSGYYNYGHSVQPTADGGYIVTGWLTGHYACLIKTDTDGNEVWTRRFGGENSSEGLSVKQTSDGGYIVAGLTHDSVPDRYLMYLVRTDADGNEVWSRTYEGAGVSIGYSVLQAADGGFVVLGETHPKNNPGDIWLVKADASGNQVWARTYGATNEDDAGCEVQATADGGYVLVGVTGGGLGQVVVVKTDADGNEVWTREFGGDQDDVGYSVQQTTDGDYIVTGLTESYGAGHEDVYLLRLDASGQTVWTRTYGGPADDVGCSVRQTSDDGFIVSGYTMSYGAGDCDIWLIKTDAEGYAEP